MGETQHLSSLVFIMCKCSALDQRSSSQGNVILASKTACAVGTAALGLFFLHQISSSLYFPWHQGNAVLHKVKFWHLKTGVLMD